MTDLRNYAEQLKQIETEAEKARQRVSDLYAAIGKAPGDAGLKAKLEAEIGIVTKLVGVYNDLAAAKSKASTGVGTTISGGKTAGPAPATPPTASSAEIDVTGIPQGYRESVQKAIKAMEATGRSVRAVGELEKAAKGLSSVVLTAVGSDPLSMPKNYKLFVDSIGNYGTTLKRLAHMQFVTSPENLETIKFAESRGFPAEGFRKMTGSDAGVYKIAEFRKNESGVEEQLRVRRDVQGGLSSAPVQKQFQGFAQGLSRDLGELLKWSLAISAIYGPINALSEAMQQLIENESKLADVSIAVNEELANTSDIFDDVYAASKSSGEAVSGVIDAFGQAFTAAGRIDNEFARYNATVKLLDDSLRLSKLSTLDQAGAIDVLTAALSQFGDTEDPAEKLSRGGELLDKWIRVSKVASVDVATLATGVAVLGDTAETAGLSIEQLNALVATIAETSLAGGKEAANIAKALVGNFQQESAVKELNRLGIAVVDTTGKTRQFLSVMQDVAALRNKGILGDQDFSRLTLALGGGGIRRQADVARFIENFGRMEQIVGLQAGAEGEGAAALAKKLETVQTAGTNLGNAFTSLAQSLGDEGGLLSVFKLLLDTGTGLVDIFDKVASSAGKVGPLLAIAAISPVLLGRGGLAGSTNALFNNLLGPMASRFGAAPGTPGYGASQASAYRGAEYLTGSRSFGGATGALGRLGNIPSIAAIGLPTIQNIAGGDYEEAGANIAGGIAGALVGGPVGALVGSAIAEAFVRTTITYETQLVDFFAGVITKADEAAIDTAPTVSPDELMARAFKEIGYGSEGFGKVLAQSLYARSQNDLATKQRYGGSFATVEAAALALLKDENPDLVAQLEAMTTAQTGRAPGVQLSELEQRQVDIATPQNLEYLSGISREKQADLQTQLIKGEIKPSDYANKMANLSAFTITATRYMAALIDETGKLSGEFDSSTQAYDDFLQIAGSGNQELINQLNAQIEAIEYYQAQLKEWTAGTPITNKLTGEQFVPGSKADIESLLTNAIGSYTGTLQFGAQQSRLQGLKIPDVFGGNITPTPTTDISKVIAETQRVQERRYGGLEPKDYQALKESWEPFKQLAEEAGKVFYEEITGIDKSIYGEVFQQMQKEGKISSLAEGPGFTTLDVSKPQLDAAVIQANQLTGRLQQEYGYIPNLEDTLVATNDEQISKQHVDMKILQYILNQILDTEKKQLEGVYNLPEGATAWVPLTAAWLAQRPYGGEDAMGLGQGAGFDLKNPSLVQSNEPNILHNLGEKNYVPGMEVGNLISDLEANYIRSGTPTGGLLSGDKQGYSPVNPLMSSFLPIPESTKQSTPMDYLKQLIPTDFLKELLQLDNLRIPGFGSDKSFDRLGRGWDGKSSSLQTGQAQGLTTKLDLKLTSTTQLIVDGRVLASIIKPYLASDMLKTNESGGTITRSYVI